MGLIFIELIEVLHITGFSIIINISYCVSIIFRAFLKINQVDIEAFISDDVDGEIAEAQEDKWLLFFLWLITAVGWFLKRGG